MRTRVQLLREFSDGHVRNRLESWAVAGARAGVEYRYPLLDKRIVEFALGLPAQMYRLQGHSRFLFRAAVAGTVPDEICWHDEKNEPTRVSEGTEILIQFMADWTAAAARQSRFVDMAALAHWLQTSSQARQRDYSQYLYDCLAALKAGLIADFESRHGGAAPIDE
jgi:asparagine synthetase B (glutamine-hydrolysing)